VAACCLLATGLGLLTARAGTVVPLAGAHAHNDYRHARPLLDALAHGFTSVEADIHLVDGSLLVAHERTGVRPERTLPALYLQPLRERVRQNAGRVYPGGPEFTLLVDLKSDWRQTYPVLRGLLTRYADMLTTFRNGTIETNAVRVIVSGHRAREMFAGETVRYAALDGGLADLDGRSPASLIPWISSAWTRTFRWRGEGPMPPEELDRLKHIVARAHQQGRRVRFWGAPDNPAAWRVLRAAGVDLINTDHLAGLGEFLRSDNLSPP